MLPERHAELVPRLKQQEYHEHRILEEMAFKVLDWFYKKKGSPTMLDIASILEKSDDPSFVHFRKCRDMLLHQGKVEAVLEMRFGARGLHTMEKIRSLENIETLKEIYILAKDSESVENFEARLQNYLE